MNTIPAQYTLFLPSSKLGNIWLFCTVIDNFGDIGVAWRLAQELHNRLNYQVFLFLDNWEALERIVPDFRQHHAITLKKWREGEWADFGDLEQMFPPKIVIETFACALPDAVLDVMLAVRPIWLNWEYLSAEDWAIRTHTMKSLQNNGLDKYFWQMGFCEQSGGLLREKSILPVSITPEITPNDDATHFQIFLFAYPSDTWQKHICAWQQVNLDLDLDKKWKKWAIRVANEKIFQALTIFHKNINESKLLIELQNFVPQNQLDELFSQQDILIVRGEDSFVRAQFSGKPFFWHIYPQDENAHWEKLDAFWEQVYPLFPKEISEAHRALSHDMNGKNSLSDEMRLAHWRTLLMRFADWQRASIQWQNFLLNQKDSMTKLQEWLEQIR